jgi:hypothetical protein
MSSEFGEKVARVRLNVRIECPEAGHYFRLRNHQNATPPTTRARASSSSRTFAFT